MEIAEQDLPGLEDTEGAGRIDLSLVALGDDLRRQRLLRRLTTGDRRSEASDTRSLQHEEADRCEHDE